ncbi:MAG: hypothetical protein HWN66_08330 [Candidatus Helarchaeota archaeon]|nr:hypothetical protein [Candidatus Helarchaeota archaeon]
MLEIINTIDKGIKFLKDKDVRGAIESFGDAMAQSGKNLEEEVHWVGERGLELILNVRIALFSATWFYFSLHLGTQGNEQLNYLSQAQGLISFDNLILKPVVGRVFKSLQEKGKIPSRNLAITMVAIDNGIKELGKLVKESLNRFISIPEPKEEAPQKENEEQKGVQKPIKRRKKRGSKSKN